MMLLMRIGLDAEDDLPLLVRRPTFFACFFSRGDLAVAPIFFAQWAKTFFTKLDSDEPSRQATWRFKS